MNSALLLIRALLDTPGGLPLRFTREPKFCDFLFVFLYTKEEKDPLYDQKEILNEAVEKFIQHTKRFEKSRM